MAVALGTLLAASAAACGDDDKGDPIQGRLDDETERDDTPTTDAQGEALPPLQEVDITLTSIGEFDSPIAIVPRANDTSLYVAGFNGTVTEVEVEGEGADRTYTVADEPLLDIDDQVITDGEQGLLDIEFSPDGARLYVSYTAEPDGTSTVAAYDFDGETVDEGSRKEILTVEDFAPNHNGGDITFGPDGYLYVAMGDGGGGGDPEENGQDPHALLGSILRIDPEGAVGTDEGYLIPPDNPFADGADGAPEVWLYGVRNPWRYSFDSATGDLWIGDVGQGSWEEIDWLPASEGGGKGANLGWNEMEGSHPFEDGTNPEGATLPIYEYETRDGCAITGGVVYRGPVRELEGAYLFGDSCQNYVRGLRAVDGEVVEDAEWEDAGAEQLVSFGTDNNGDVYVVGLMGGEIHRIDG
ncbi:MAG TPA: PQQ-dependent sugar dehydrogenase [Acidimicrobiales bacterium]